MQPEDGPDILAFPPLVSLVAPLCALALEWLLPLKVLPTAGTPVLLFSGLVLMVLSGWLAVAGERAFRRAGTNVDPRKPALRLVREGPFRFTRNPMYLGMVALQLGLALTFSLDWAVPGAVVVFLILHFGVVLREEAYLLAMFGDDYKSFLTGPRRWL